jgi:hypothetical protein
MTLGMENGEKMSGLFCIVLIPLSVVNILFFLFGKQRTILNFLLNHSTLARTEFCMPT